MLTRPLGRPKNRWEDDIRNDMKKLKIKNWTSYVQDRNNWKLYVVVVVFLALQPTVVVFSQHGSGL